MSNTPSVVGGYVYLYIYMCRRNPAIVLLVFLGWGAIGYLHNPW